MYIPISAKLLRQYGFKRKGSIWYKLYKTGKFFTVKEDQESRFRFTTYDVKNDYRINIDRLKGLKYRFKTITGKTLTLPKVL